MSRIIGHLDMDAFFAAVEERDNLRFKGKPIVVGADPEGGKGRGVVSTANYTARKYGIHSAMPISTAWRLAEEAGKRGEPGTLFLGVNFEKYKASSRNVLEIVNKHVPFIEKASIDEFYLDLTFTKSFSHAESVAKRIKSEVKKKEKLTCSIGISSNKLIAKIASDMRKPDGLTVVIPEEVHEFLEPLPVRKIPGIGPKAEAKFSKLGVKTVGDIKKLSKFDLQRMMGKWGVGIYNKARGIGIDRLEDEREAKSIGEQETFPEDTKDLNKIFGKVENLSRDIIRKFKDSGFKSYRTVVVTVRFRDFETKSRTHTLEEFASDFETLRFEALKLLMPFMDKRENPKRKLIRLVGVKIEKLI